MLKNAHDQNGQTILLKTALNSHAQNCVGQEGGREGGREGGSEAQRPRCQNQGQHKPIEMKLGVGH